LRSLERQAKRALEHARAQEDLKVVLREWYGFHWHRAQRDLADVRESARGQEARVEAARQYHQKAQEQYLAFRGRLSGLRAELNSWHRQAAELHNLR